MRTCTSHEQDYTTTRKRGGLRYCTDDDLDYKQRDYQYTSSRSLLPQWHTVLTFRILGHNSRHLQL